MRSDTGLYTCTASSESGETSWSASLSVDDPKDPNIIFHKTPDPSTFPPAPTAPRVVDRRATSVTLGWRDGGREDSGLGGSSPLIGYTVEYFSADLQTGWVTAAHRVPSETYTVANLKPNTNYVFLVRAENSHGMSPPSRISQRVRTLRANKEAIHHEVSGEADLARARDALSSARLVELSSLESVSSTSIRVSWRLRDDEESAGLVEGFFVRFRDMSGGSQKFNMKTVMLDDADKDGDGLMCTVTDLRKFTEYEVFVTPFYDRLEGQPSNSLHVQTLEDAPSAPPSDVSASATSATAAEIRWHPPPPQHRNGGLLGYEIHVKRGAEAELAANVTANSTTTVLLLEGLEPRETYSVRACALTAAGRGPFSFPPAEFKTDPELIRYPVVGNRAPGAELAAREAWLAAALMGASAAALAVGLAAVIAYRRHRCWGLAEARRTKSLARLTAPSPARGAAGSSARYGEIGWDWKSKAYAEEDDHALYAEVGEASATSEGGLLSTFNLGGVSDPAPYATTTLAMQNRTRNLVSPRRNEKGDDDDICIMGHQSRPISCHHAS